MKIVHVVEPFASGIAVFVKSLVENLSNDQHIIVHGEREYVMSFADVKQHFPKDNVRFIRWRSAQREISIRKDLIAFLELYTILKRLKKGLHIDAVHLHSSKSGFLGRLACRIAKIKTVVYTPNGAPFLIGSNRLINYVYKQLERIGSLFGGKVVCCSPSERDAYQALGIDALNINNGVTVTDPAPAVLKTIVSPSRTQKFRVVTSGRIVGQKNPALFNSIAAYFSDFGDFEFIWVGDGPDRGTLTAGNIAVTGWLPAEETSSLITSSDVYLSTAIFEGMSFAVLEALALRKPVLLSDCVGNRDIVQNGLNGDLFRNEEEATLKILQYYNNRDMLNVMGEYSSELCRQEFDVHSTFTAYRDLYMS
ncbi:MAG: glycosyltransferase [Bacteroidota bacterium]|nr:glycosyltransferase [Bacteroidota bacterium]MDP4215172.1 glycosyltransferase [Bacteroidota bacterium]MDP4246713.1 glycosyltransferase [Bacteroidota bacterium]MDP4252671.1 glycosyltransferase [Bacteroidota bacterium]MDP4256694.1 glycosyltransferase [Bacteroidota bacterium]